jgi:outer membrane lipoprotein-sorting protein
MKRIVVALLIVFFQLSFLPAVAQTARQVLDKCAAVVSNPDGMQADFTMNSSQYGDSSGHIMVKGRKFTATMPKASLWFDGSTLWTYMSNNNEVNVTTPTESQLQVLNPYNFINMYKEGFKYTMTTSAGSYQVHLTATDPKRKVQEMFITVDQKSYHPTQVKLLQDSRWTVFNITDLKKATLADGEFRFNSKDYPTAEVIDLR